MNYRDIPGFSRLFIDWVEGIPASEIFLPRRPNVDALVRRATEIKTKEFPRAEIHSLLVQQAPGFATGDRALKNIDRLLQPDCAVVLIAVPATFAGGSLSLLLKCLTAAKLAAELERIGVTTVPVCWLTSDAQHEPLTSYAMLDRTGGLRRLEFIPKKAETGIEAGDWLVPEEVEDCYHLLEDVLSLDFSDPILQELKKAFVPGTSLRRAAARFLSALVGEWGVVFLDPNLHVLEVARRLIRERGILVEDAVNGSRTTTELLRTAGYCPSGDPEKAGVHQGSSDELHFWPVTQAYLEALLPVAAHVVDQRETCGLALTTSLARVFGLAAPLFWPRTSVTIVDPRSNKTLKKHGLELSDLFRGKVDLVRRLGREDAVRETSERIDGLEQIINKTFGEMSVSPEAEQGGLNEETRGKLLFQLEKLKERYIAAADSRRDAVVRQIEKLADNLAPEGKVQEEVIGALHFLLRNSSDFLQRLYDGLDTKSFTHQLIILE